MNKRGSIKRHGDMFIAAMVAMVTAVGGVTGCAKQGYPSGGPVDRTPPKVVSVTPESGTKNFEKSEFTLQMDEYITIKDADNNVLVSPPMKQKAEYVVRGRNIIVRMKDTLQENTTYLFQFKGAIADFNEGNVLPSYEYVFSTGSSIDSMTLRGRVLDALTLKASKETVSVLAYTEDAADSAVALEPPRYYTRCDTAGNFAFNHIAAGRYRIVALVDGDRDMRLDAGEAVAFLDSAVTAQAMPKEKAKDTTATDSLLRDTIVRAADSSLAAGKKTEQYDYIEPDSMARHLMLLSLLKVEQQRVMGSKALESGHFQIVTKNPLTERMTLKHLMADSGLTFQIHLNAQRDTLEVWTDEKRVDSVVVVLTDTMLEDTLSLQYHQRTIGKKRQTEAREVLKVRSLVATNHPYYDSLRLRVGSPLKEYNPEEVVRVMDLKDSSVRMCGVKAGLAGKEREAALEATIDFAGVAGGKYKITIPAGVFTDIYGVTNDSLSISTTYTKPESYGTITLTVDSKRSPLLVQLLNEKGDLVSQEPLEAAGKVTFAHLKAGKYSFRLVEDADGDGQWSAGDYWTKRQPEAVTYMGKVLDLRENWEITERFHW